MQRNASTCFRMGKLQIWKHCTRCVHSGTGQTHEELQPFQHAVAITRPFFTGGMTATWIVVSLDRTGLRISALALDRLATYADCVIIYALCVITRAHWTASFPACGRVCLQLLWADQGSGGISPSWQTFFIRDHPACNGNSDHCFEPAHHLQ